MAEVSQAIGADEIAASLPRRLHAVVERHVAETPDHVALAEDGTAWSYRDLDRHVRDIARELSSFGVRAGDRMMVVSENCIALAGLLLAASRLDAWAIVANPRLVPERSIKFVITAARGRCSLRRRFQSKQPRTPRASGQQRARSARSGKSASAR